LHPLIVAGALIALYLVILIAEPPRRRVIMSRQRPDRTGRITGVEVSSY